MNNPEVEVGVAHCDPSQQTVVPKLSVGANSQAKQLQAGSLSKRQASTKENNNSTGLLHNMHGAAFNDQHMKLSKANSTSEAVHGGSRPRAEVLRAAH
jgi:hypothetical protein